GQVAGSYQLGEFQPRLVEPRADVQATVEKRHTLLDVPAKFLDQHRVGPHQQCSQSLADPISTGQVQAAFHVPVEDVFARVWVFHGTGVKGILLEADESAI